MAHAQFHKNQRVYVRPVGTWAQIERVIPHWTKGLEAPIRIHYDVGLGREFTPDELQAETDANSVADGILTRLHSLAMSDEIPSDFLSPSQHVRL